jgi:hypothetical protein
MLQNAAQCPEIGGLCVNVNEYSVSTKGEKFLQKLTNNALTPEKGSASLSDIVYFIYLYKRQKL